MDHNNHEAIFLGDLMPNIDEKKKFVKVMKSIIDSVSGKIKEIIRQLNGFMNTINTFYEINNNIVNNFDLKNRNYQNLENIKELRLNNKIFEAIKKINNNKNKEILIDILDLYNNISKEDRKIINAQPIKIDEKIKSNNEGNIISNSNNITNKKDNEITIVYDIKNKDKVKLFDKNFIKNNKDNCHLLINNQKSELKEFLEINPNQDNLLEIKLIVTKPISNLRSMFYKCNSLISISGFSNLDTKNVTEMSYIFSDCTSLKSLPDISNWDTKNVERIDYIFNKCISLISLADIYKWDTKNVTNMSYMFYKCGSLVSLPDISKWDTKNVTNMNHIFNGCSSLISLPDISKWDIKNVTDINSMFYECSSLKSLPEFYKKRNKH